MTQGALLMRIALRRLLAASFAAFTDVVSFVFSSATALFTVSVLALAAVAPTTLARLSECSHMSPSLFALCCKA